MAVISTTTTKAINLAQLASELFTLINATQGSIALNGLGNVGDPTDSSTTKTISYSQDPAPGTLQQLQTAITNHAFNVDFGVPQSLINLRNVASTLQLWATDATAVGAQGSNVSQAQLKTMFTRLGVMLNRMADIIVGGGLGS